MKLTFLILLFFPIVGLSQTPEEVALTSSLTIIPSVPSDLLSSRAVVLFQNTYTKSELEETQKYFQQTGIDAVCYFDIAYVLAGTDTRRAFAAYFSFRNIKYIVLLQKADNQYRYVFGTFCGNKDIFDRTSTGWRQSNPSQVEVLRTIYR